MFWVVINKVSFFFLAPFCNCNRTSDNTSCDGNDCPCHKTGRRCHAVKCRCKNKCRNAGKVIENIHWKGKCTCGQNDPNGSHCLPVDGGARKRECPCRKFSVSCNTGCRCKGCEFGKPPSKTKMECRSSRNDPKPYNRERSSVYTSKKADSDEFPQGRWSEIESVALLTMYKYAMRMQSGTEDVIGMYTGFELFNRNQVDRLLIREKSSRQISMKLINLNCIVNDDTEVE